MAAEPDPLPGPVEHFIFFTGADVKEDSYFGYAGGIFALHGLGTDSIAARAFIGGGEFDYFAQPSGFFPGGTVDGDTLTFDIQGGYRKHIGDVQVGVYAGVNYWDITHSINALGAPSVNARGERFGVKIDAEINRSGGDPFYLDARGSYSSAFDTYWARGRIGYDLGMVTIGPEGVVLGNDDFDQYRIGGFALFDVLDTGVSLSISAGYADVDGVTGQDSAYGSAGISTTF